ncbi:DUF3703 domain-containing protein [Vulgatibacter sp.]|uniref:DUF3703 domain-containing protein n=1 Tax=Vulgatibacter sp. TaxID=1971226 RepID=UPI0035675479
MNQNLRKAYDLAIEKALQLMQAGDYYEAHFHLERAHVLGQRFVVPHVRSHWLMLRVEIARRAPGAALGQAVRIYLGALGSAVGVVPVGNTGGSDVSMFARMPVPGPVRLLIEGEEGR